MPTSSPAAREGQTINFKSVANDQYTSGRDLNVSLRTDHALVAHLRQVVILIRSVILVKSAYIGKLRYFTRIEQPFRATGPECQ